MNKIDNNLCEKSCLSNNSKMYKELLLCFFIGVLGRVFPHVPNVTPITGLSLIFGCRFKSYIVSGFIFLTLLCSDFLLSIIYGFPVFSYISLFVYSGFYVITYFSKVVVKKINLRYFPILMLGSSLFYWLWTNFGVWLCSNLYTKNLFGLYNCYMLALPFLRNALIGDFVWGIVIIGVLKFQYNKREWRNWQTRWI